MAAKKRYIADIGVDDVTRGIAAGTQGIDALVENMKKAGMVEPIVVRKLADGKFELVAGQKRLAAAKRLGWKTVEAVVRE
jgi:ParB/RepB/Spo0J family partition protein